MYIVFACKNCVMYVGLVECEEYDIGVSMLLITGESTVKINIKPTNIRKLRIALTKPCARR